MGREKPPKRKGWRKLRREKKRSERSKEEAEIVERADGGEARRGRWEGGRQDPRPSEGGGQARASVALRSGVLPAWRPYLGPGHWAARALHPPPAPGPWNLPGSRDLARTLEGTGQEVGLPGIFHCRPLSRPQAQLLHKTIFLWGMLMRPAIFASPGSWFAYICIPWEN